MRFTRRQVLRSAGVALALQCLDAFSPIRASAGAMQPRRRMVCICAPLGLRPDNFFPEKSGKDYEFTPYLELLKDYRDDFTVISGLSHTGMSSGFAHQSSASFLTGIPGAGRIGFRNSISLDQLAAEHIGGQTRFPSLTLSGDGQGMSWTRTGAIVPADNSPSRVFARLFLEGSADEVQAQVRRLEDGRSILDDVRDQAAGLQSDLGSDDRDKLEESSPASASWSSGWSRTKAGSRRPNPRSMSNRPRIFPMRPT
jgi:hypothetical protein